MLCSNVEFPFKFYETKGEQKVHFLKIINLYYSVHGLPNEEFSVSAKGDLILRKTVDFEVLEQYNFR